MIGSFGLFFTAFLLFARVLPFIAISEVKGVLAYGRKRGRVAVARDERARVALEVLDV